MPGHITQMIKHVNSPVYAKCSKNGCNSEVSNSINITIHSNALSYILQYTEKWPPNICGKGNLKWDFELKLIAKSSLIYIIQRQVYQWNRYTDISYLGHKWLLTKAMTGTVIPHVPWRILLHEYSDVQLNTRTVRALLLHTFCAIVGYCYI